MRARNLKPAFFKNEHLAELSFEYRILFQGLWCLADREGRLEDRPKRIKADIFPYDNVDVSGGLDALAAKGFVIRYNVNGKGYLQISKFVKHQSPHIKETASTIPAPCDTDIEPCKPDAKSPPSPLLNPSSPSPSPEVGASPTLDEGPKPEKFTVSKIEFPENLRSPAFKTAWSEWVAHRKQLRKPLTELAVKKQLADLARAGPDVAVKAIHEAVRSGWTGLFPEKVNGNNKRTERTREPWENLRETSAPEGPRTF